MNDNETNKEKNQSVKKIGRFSLGSVISIVTVIILVLGFLNGIWDSLSDREVLEPRFSIEKNTDIDGVTTWKIHNSGGAISNGIIYPTMYVTFSLYDNEQRKDIDITLEISGYYTKDSYYYKSSEGAFYITERQQSELDEFIDKWKKWLHTDDIKYLRCDANTTLYFTLKYDDYKGNPCTKIYTVSKGSFIDEDLGGMVVQTDSEELREISKLPTPDIEASIKVNGFHTISINYKNARTIQPIDNEQDYNNYLHSAILDLANGTEKNIEEMYGMVILSNGTLWFSDTNTGILNRLGNDIRQVGFSDDGVLHCLDTHGNLYVTLLPFINKGD